MSDRAEQKTAAADEVQDWRELLESANSTMHVEAFLVQENLTRSQFGEVLREYRSESGWSPWAGRDEVDAEFLNWYRWERLA